MCSSDLAGKTLAKYNAEGVTHADMEKTGREAYEIMSHRCRYDGGTHNGVPYITFNNFKKFGEELPQGGAEFCTEGDGYMLLAAAIFADQPTFNGLWMWIHDNRCPHVIRYQDGQERFSQYEFGKGNLPICYADENSPSNINDGSATDGDFDIAMALLIAYKQWGEFMYQNGNPVLDYNGKHISYKDAAQKIVKCLVDTFPSYMANGVQNGWFTGDIGVDGYVKSGNKQGELTNWLQTQTTYPEMTGKVNHVGGINDFLYVDYIAPSYFNEFYQWLKNEDGDGTDWQINQFKRAEASSDWLVGQAYSKGYIASIGKAYKANDAELSFGPFNDGEDFRFAWRTILNYVWHGNPETAWDPINHDVITGGNTYNYDMAKRHASFLKQPSNGLGGDIYCQTLVASPVSG